MCVQGEKDWQKYETARRLKKCVERLRTQYREDWKSKEMRIRQRSVALYFIDKVRAPRNQEPSTLQGHTGSPTKLPLCEPWFLNDQMDYVAYGSYTDTLYKKNCM